MDLSTLIKAKRAEKQITLKELVVLTGVDAALLNKYEKGDRSVPEKQLEVIIDKLELDRNHARTLWLSERIYQLFETDRNLLNQAVSFAEERLNYTKKKLSEQEANYTSQLTHLLDECSRLHKIWSAKKPLNNTQLRKMEEYFNLNYTYESNRIEGNTLTLQETYLVINDGITVGGKSVREHLEVLNHAEAIDYLSELVQNKTSFTERIVKQLHYMVLKGIDRANAGVYRSIDVRISGSSHIPPQPYLLVPQMEEVFAYYQANKNLVHPVILAAEMHEQIVKIHPFIDGNGRTCRLVMNLILMQHGYPIANIKGELESRLRYYNALESARMDNKDKFYCLIADAVIQALNEHIDLSA